MNQAVQDLENKIKYHKSLYYQGKPEISDRDYDLLEDKLKKIYPESPILKLVGTTLSKEDKCKHDTKMLSLNKTYSEEELLSWIGEHTVVSMHKIDGVSCSLIYQNGILNIGKTRGDGQFGENITEKVKWLNTIPTSLNYNEKCEVRGELFCTENNFMMLSEEMESRGLERPSSQRNIVAGLMGRKENLDLCRYLTFYAFDFISDDKSISDEDGKFKKLQKLHFNTPEVTLHKNTKKITSVIESTLLFMNEGEYQIDGIVFSYNDLEVQDQLGNTSHHPRFKMAYKYAGDSKKTIINDISWQVSRNGILTPIANVEPVDLGGAKISRVTLHNYGQVKSHNLKSGDQIMIIRSGEVIPKFLSVVKEGDNEFTFPSLCPSCNNEVEVHDIRLMCLNKKCPVRVREEILNFISKIGIEDLSEKRLSEMMKMKLVNSIPDLFRLKKEDLLNLDKVKDKLANKLLDSIEKAKKNDLITFLSSLGIRGGAYNKCEKVVMAGFHTLESILNLSELKLAEVDGFAEKSASDFLQSLNDKRNMIDELLSLGINLAEDKRVESPITLKKICITGSLSRKRAEIENLIRDKGGVVSSSVGKTTDYLLTNEKEGTSSKFKKATALGITIITEEDFILLVNT